LTFCRQYFFGFRTKLVKRLLHINNLAVFLLYLKCFFFFRLLLYLNRSSFLLSLVNLWFQKGSILRSSWTVGCFGTWIILLKLRNRPLFLLFAYWFLFFSSIVSFSIPTIYFARFENPIFPLRGVSSGFSWIKESTRPSQLVLNFFFFNLNLNWCWSRSWLQSTSHNLWCHKHIFSKLFWSTQISICIWLRSVRIETISFIILRFKFPNIFTIFFINCHQIIVLIICVPTSRFLLSFLIAIFIYHIKCLGDCSMLTVTSLINGHSLMFCLIFHLCFWPYLFSSLEFLILID